MGKEVGSPIDEADQLIKKSIRYMLTAKDQALFTQASSSKEINEFLDIDNISNNVASSDGIASACWRQATRSMPGGIALVPRIRPNLTTSSAF